MQIAALHHLIDCAGGHHFDVHARADHAVHHAKIDHNAAIAVILAVKDQRLQRRVPVALGGRDLFDDHFQHSVDVDAVFGRDLRGFHGGDADDILDLLLDLLGPGCGQVDLVDHGQNLQPGVDGKIGVGQGLRLDALGGVHDQNRALAGCERAGDLIVEVHVARGVDEVEHIVLPVVGPVVELDGAGLDGDAPLPLKLHIIQNLLLHLALVHGVGLFQQAVCQGGLAVVDVGHDGEVSQLA